MYQDGGGRILRGDNDTKALPRDEQHPATLSPLCGIQERAVPDAERLLRQLHPTKTLPFMEQLSFRANALSISIQLPYLRTRPGPLESCPTLLGRLHVRDRTCVRSSEGLPRASML